MIRLEDYIGQYIDKGKSLGYQSTDLVSQYVEDLTNGEYTTYLDARLTHQEKLPRDWEIIEVDSKTEFKKGDIFVRDNALRGFNGIVYDMLNDTELIVITQNFNGLNGKMFKEHENKPVFQHTLSIEKIGYIIRPESKSLRDIFGIDNDEAIKINSTDYNSLVDKALKYDKIKEIIEF